MGDIDDFEDFQKHYFQLLQDYEVRHTPKEAILIIIYKKFCLKKTKLGSNSLIAWYIFLDWSPVFFNNWAEGTYFRVAKTCVLIP